jgi:ferredoxin-NADP reductase
MNASTTLPGLTLRLKNRHEVAEGTMAFQFEKPPGWTFKPGQFMDVTLINPLETDAEGNSRAFSIASAPYEDGLMIATRMRDTAFKRVLKTMPLESQVKIEGPSGDLTLHDNASQPAVLLAGGIGITPFRSIVLQAAKDKLAHRIFLFYSNRRPEDAPFLKELESLEYENPNFELIGTMTDMVKSQRPWSGEAEQISQGMLAKYLKGVEAAIYYIAGPPAMVKGLNATLKRSGIDDGDIRAEEFAGY